MIFLRRKRRRVLQRLLDANAVPNGAYWLFGRVLFAEGILSRWNGYAVLGWMESLGVIEGKKDPVSGLRCYAITDRGRAWLSAEKVKG